MSLLKFESNRLSLHYIKNDFDKKTDVPNCVSLYFQGYFEVNITISYRWNN